MNGETWKATLVLLGLMSLSILAINLVPQQETLVPLATLRALEEAGLVGEVQAGPEELSVLLTEAVSIRSERARMRTNAVRLVRSDSTRTFEKIWADRGILIFSPEGARAPMRGEWVLIGLLVAGCSFAVIKAQRDRRNGSIRKQIEDLKSAYDCGAIDESEYSKRLAELTPYM